MEHVTCRLDDEMFDKAVHGGLDGNPTLKECGDLAFYFKRKATTGGKPMAVITFTVQLPDGTFARAQAVTTLALLEAVHSCIKGWREGDHL